MPVDVAEGELPEVVDTAFLEQLHRAKGEGEIALMRFDVVAEVDQQCLAVARLDEAIGMPVEVCDQGFSTNMTDDVGCKALGLEVGDRARFRGGDVGGVAEDKDVRVIEGLERVLVGWDEVEVVAHL